MATSYSSADANKFINDYASLRLKGNSGLTLQSYLNTHVPAWGVIVTPPSGRDTLVWYDAANRLHVVDVAGEPMVESVIKPAYHTDDESFLFNLSKNAAAALPTIPDLKSITTLLMVAIAFSIFSSVSGVFRK